MNSFRTTVWAIALLLIVSMIGCSSGDDQSDPRKLVISMFGAMEKDDKATLAHILDLPELMKTTSQDYSLTGGDARVWTNPEQVLDDLTGQGKTKTTWFAYQRIVNKSEIFGETGTVEVTFVDKAKSQGYRTKFGVHKVNDKWKIYSFKTIQGEN